MIVESSCGTMGNGEVIPQSQDATPELVSKKATEPCMAIIDWVDFLMINNIKYYQNNDGTKAVTSVQLGDKVEEVSYMLNEHACTDHVAKMTQLKGLYKDSWETIIGNCDTILFLGGQERSTLEWVNKGLGKQTIDTKNSRP